MVTSDIGSTPVRHPSSSADYCRVVFYLLSDGISYWDGGGAFGLVPRVKWMKLLTPDELNRVPQDLRCVLIEAHGKDASHPTRILVDCGVGNKPNDIVANQFEVRRPYGTLLDDLARHGLAPAAIDVVIFTHLHGDHSGWATVRLGGAAGSTLVPTFPNARYYVQRQEYEDATHTNERTRNTYFQENYVPLLEHGVLTLLDGPADIAPGVRVVPTPGHTAGHQSVILAPSLALPILEEGRSDGQPAPALILGDMATYMIQFARLPWLTAYDISPLQNIETKRYWQQWALGGNAILISPHDTLVPAGRLVRDERGFLKVDILPIGN